MRIKKPKITNSIRAAEWDPVTNNKAKPNLRTKRILQKWFSKMTRQVKSPTLPPSLTNWVQYLRPTWWREKQPPRIVLWLLLVFCTAPCPPPHRNTHTHTINKLSVITFHINKPERSLANFASRCFIYLRWETACAERPETLNTFSGLHTPRERRLVLMEHLFHAKGHWLHIHCWHWSFVERPIVPTCRQATVPSGRSLSLSWTS